MSGLSIKSNVDRMAAQLNAQARQQLAYGTSLALNAIAAHVLQAEQENERRQLDRPRPFTVNALRVIKSNKRDLVARVVMMDKTAEYLEPYEDGGENVLNGKALLKPVGAVKDLDRYGNLPRGLIAKLKTRTDVFIGKVKTKDGMVSGVWQRSTDEGAKVGVMRRRRDGSMVLGKTGKSLNSTGRLKLLIRFSDAHPIAQKNRLHWHDIAAATVLRTADLELARGIAQALRTAKRR